MPSNRVTKIIDKYETIIRKNSGLMDTTIKHKLKRGVVLRFYIYMEKSV